MKSKIAIVPNEAEHFHIPLLLWLECSWEPLLLRISCEGRRRSPQSPVTCELTRHFPNDSCVNNETPWHFTSTKDVTNLEAKICFEARSSCVEFSFSSKRDICVRVCPSSLYFVFPVFFFYSIFLSILSSSLCIYLFFFSML